MLFTVPQNFEFVKYFFQSFFDVTRSSQEQQLFKFTTLGSVCQELFSEVFEARFRYLSGNHFRLPHLVAAVKCFFHFTLWRSDYRADSFVRIPNHSAFVNTIFQLSSLFLFFTITPPYPSPTSVHFEERLQVFSRSRSFKTLFI